MGQQPAFEETCERYLLGELSEADRERFEEDYFADDELFERFLAVKDELLDLYARGELAEEKRARFASHFLTTAPRRRQLDETQNFIRAVTVVSTKAAATDNEALDALIEIETQKSSRQSFTNFFNLRPFAWQFALASVLLAAFFGVWLFFRSGQQAAPDELASGQPTPAPTTAPTGASPTNESENTNSGNNTSTTPTPTTANVNQSPTNTNVSTQPTPKKPTVQPPQMPAQIASLMLLPVASRDINDANTLRLNSDTRTVRLSLAFKSDDYRNYSAAISTIAGATVWQQKTLKANPNGGNKSVTLQFAPTLLRGQDYIVTLKGQTAGGQTETIGEYYFRVERRLSQNTPTTKP